MSELTSQSNPYARFEGSPEWNSLDRAVRELAGNHDLVETTQHAYIVGYLCKSLEDVTRNEPTREQRLAAWERLRAHVRESNLHGRDLVGELIAERRAEAALE